MAQSRTTIAGDAPIGNDLVERANTIGSAFATAASALDAHLLAHDRTVNVRGFRRFCLEFLYFGIKEARACLFAGLFFAAIFLIPRGGLFGLPRYDVLLVVALLIQAWMLWAKLETVDEAKAIALFHVIGFALEVFKTSAGIQSWAYPDFAYSKLFGVPLFSGFMYSAIGSYIIQAWRLLDVRIKHHPPYWMAGLLSFILIGFFIWLAENFGTFYGVWRYPNQIGAWSTVHVGKWSSWSLLVIMTFTIVVNLKHIKERIHVPQ